MKFNFPKETLIKEERQSKISYWLKRIFIDDWLMKLFALVITLALWLGVTGLQAPKTTRLRGVTLTLLVSNELDITNTPIQQVDLVITGDKSKVEQLNPNNLVVSLDLTDIQDGDRTIQITPQNVNVELPAGVKIDEIQPDKIAVKLERVQEQEVPVTAETEGEVAAGYEIYSTKVLPEKVSVRGPRSFVESLNFVSTEKIDLSERRGDFTAKQVPINVSNSKISLVNSATVTVTFRIGKKRIERLLIVPYQTETRSGRASVLLYGADTILENLSAEELLVVEQEDDSSKLRVILPEGIRGQVEVRGVKFRE
jgi:YbbR domain-containing protein